MAALNSTRPYRRGAPPSLPDEGRYVASEFKKIEDALKGIQAPSAIDISGKLDKTANLSDVTNVATARTNLGLGSAATHPATDFLLTASNLSDVVNAATARSNIGANDAGNLSTGTLPDARLSNVITAGGPVGDSTHTPVITWDAHGRLVAVSSATLSGGSGLPSDIAVIAPGTAGVVGNGSADDTSAISAAISGKLTVWVFPGTYLINTHTVYASSVTWWMFPGAKIKPGAGVTVEIFGRIIADPQRQVFDLSAGSSAVLGPRQVTPENFGAANNNSTNDAPYVQAANDSIYHGSNNGAVGPSVLQLMHGSGYRLTATVTLRPSATNPLHVKGAGNTVCGFVAASGGAGFSPGVITIRGETSGQEVMNFRLTDFFISAATRNFQAQALTLGTSGNSIGASSRRNLIQNVKISDFSVGYGWYSARQIDVEGGAVWLPRYTVTGAANNGSGAIRLTLDSIDGLSNGISVDAWNVGGVTNANGTFTLANVGAGGNTVDLSGSTWAGTFTVGGGVVPSLSYCFYVDPAAGEFAGDCNISGIDLVGGPAGPGGYGIRFRSHGTTSNIAGWRIRATFYTLRYGIMGTTASGGTMGDHWLMDGCQCDGPFGTIMDYSGSGAGVKRIAQIRVGDVYATSLMDRAFRFSGGTAEEIADVRLNGVRVRGVDRGSNNRFLEAFDLLMLTVTDCQLASFSATGSAGDVPEFIVLNNVNHAVVSNNIAIPDGSGGAINAFVNIAGSTDYVTITGNSCGQTVTNAYSGTCTHLRVGHNLPASTDI
jgi:hypothetical protein